LKRKESRKGGCAGKHSVHVIEREKMAGDFLPILTLKMDA